MDELALLKPKFDSVEALRRSGDTPGPDAACHEREVALLAVSRRAGL